MDWQALEQALAANVGLLGDALELGDEKRRVLVANDVAALEALFPQEEALAGRLAAAEQQLTGLAQDMAARLEINSMAELMLHPHCPRPEKFADLFQQLVLRLAGLGRLNQQNKILIEQSLKYIDYNLRILINSEDDPAYNAAGQSHRQATPRLVDRKM